MANVKISDLPAATTLGVTDVFPFTQSGTTKKATLAQVRPFVSVKDHGALGDGSTDDSTAIQAAIDTLTSGGTVYFPVGTYICDTTITISVNGTFFLGEGRSASILKADTSNDLITFNGVAFFRAQSLTFQCASGGGHVFVFTGTGLSQSQFVDVRAIQSETTKSIINLDTTTGINYIDNDWFLSNMQHVAAATVPAVLLRTSTNSINRNSFQKMRCDALASADHFFHVENTGASTFCQNMVFRDLNFERADGGMIKLLGCAFPILDNIMAYDITTTTDDLIYIGDGSGGAPTRAPMLIGCGRATGSLGGGFFDIQMETTVNNAILMGCNKTSYIGYEVDAGDSVGTIIFNEDKYTLTNMQRHSLIINGGQSTAKPTTIQFGNLGQPTERLAVWVTSATTNPSLGELPTDAYLLRVYCDVTEAFNSDGSDNITCGWDASASAVFGALDVATTGVKTPTIGARAGSDTTLRALEVYYTAGGTAPTLGKACVVVEYCRAPVSP